MEKINLNEYLASNEYPGRGIAVAMAPDGRQMFIGYFIMGRSENSRNRVFDPVPERGGICTIAADPAKLEDPSLIIYNPVLTLGKTHIVTNGDQHGCGGISGVSRMAGFGEGTPQQDSRRGKMSDKRILVLR